MEDEEDEEGVLEIDKLVSYKERWFDKNGHYHRLNGPAVTYADGDTSWYRHGKLHREDGPAREWPHDDVEEWFKNDEHYEPSAHELMVWKMKKKES